MITHPYTVTALGPSDRPQQIDASGSEAHANQVENLVAPEVLIHARPASTAVADLVAATRRSIREILTGSDPRLLVIVGPCSIHDTPAALVYAEWLQTARRALADCLLIVMRVYCEKPRTQIGWKGLISDPALDGTCRIDEGLALARETMCRINELGVPIATEFVNPSIVRYLEDLVSWAGIGARTSESQVHRELASALSCPVGFKNGTDGCLDVAINGVLAASSPHHFIGLDVSGHIAVVRSRGNPYCHIVLRGGSRPNHDRATVQMAAHRLRESALIDRVVIDCSHGNARGDPRLQLEAGSDVLQQLQEGSAHICGVMLESNLVPGRQLIGSPPQLRFGQSITDPCLGLDDTAAMLGSLARARAGTARG